MRSGGNGRKVSHRAGSPGRMFVRDPMPEEAAALGEDLGCHRWLEAVGAWFAFGRGPCRAVAVGISGMDEVAAAIAAQYACGHRWGE